VASPNRQYGLSGPKIWKGGARASSKSRGKGRRRKKNKSATAGGNNQQDRSLRPLKGKGGGDHRIKGIVYLGGRQGEVALLEKQTFRGLPFGTTVRWESRERMKRDNSVSRPDSRPSYFQDGRRARLTEGATGKLGSWPDREKTGHVKSWNGESSRGSPPSQKNKCNNEIPSSPARGEQKATDGDRLSLVPRPETTKGTGVVMIKGQGRGG